MESPFNVRRWQETEITALTYTVIHEFKDSPGHENYAEYEDRKAAIGRYWQLRAWGEVSYAWVIDSDGNTIID